MNIQTIEISRIFYGVHMALPIGGVITERKIFTPLCLFIQTSPIDFAVASGNGNRLLTGKRHVQISNNP